MIKIINKVKSLIDIPSPEAIQFIVIDLFCGAGGTTTGYTLARDAGGNKTAIIAACINHDHKAITSHWKNHPEVYHFEEDITKLYGLVKHGVFFMSKEILRLRRLIDLYRACYPNAKVVLWASLECTNFSKAKGGQQREQDSRTLANHLDRYIHAIDPDYIKIENVVEFMAWGPLNSKGKPISMKNGRDWLRWREHINEIGYRDEWRELNSADFGAYTSRNRLFGIFAKPGHEIAWPKATHQKETATKQDLFGQGLKPWKAVRDLLDFEDEGISIFGRKKPLVENTLKRVYAGLIKEVAGGKESFILKYNSMSKSGRHNPPSIKEPLPVIACQNRLGIVNTSFITKYFSGRPMNKIASVNNPLATITTSGNQALVRTSFITKYYGNEKGSKAIDKPLDTITTKDRFSKVNVNWLDKQYSGQHNHQSVDQPAGTIMTSDKHALMTAKGFIYNPSHGGHTMHIDQPCATIIARQDKAPLYFIRYDQCPNFKIEIYEDDSETMIKIKQFMAMYGISDIKMRMLKVSELKVIQGFPEDYILVGNQSDQKKFIGNSVVPLVVQRWAEAFSLN